MFGLDHHATIGFRVHSISSNEPCFSRLFLTPDGKIDEELLDDFCRPITPIPEWLNPRDREYNI